MKFRPVASPLDAFTTSFSSMAPTFILSFTTSLVAQSAGRAAPLAFVLGGGVMALVAVSFMAFSRRVVGAGSAMAYMEAAFGRRAAFLTGWVMLFAYVTLTAGAFSMSGVLAAQALGHVHVGNGSPLWGWIGALAGLAAAWAASRRLSAAAHLMLLLEVVSLLAVGGLALVILSRQPLSAAPLRPDPAKGVGGLGAAMVFTILAFTGFETSTTLSEETRDAARSIPRAILAAVAVAAAVYGFVSYAQVLGYGPGGADRLAAAAAPLDELASRYVSDGYGVFLDAAAAVSAFACTLGFTTATARILYALGAGGLDGRLTALDARHLAPRRAIVVTAASALGLLAAFGWLGRQTFTSGVITAGTLALIAVYMAVCVAHGAVALRERRRALAAAGWAGAALLLWPLWGSLYPAPPWPGALWPLAVVAWIAVGAALLVLHPGLRTGRVEAAA